MVWIMLDYYDLQSSYQKAINVLAQSDQKVSLSLVRHAQRTTHLSCTKVFGSITELYSESYFKECTLFRNLKASLFHYYYSKHERKIDIQPNTILQLWQH